MTENERRLREVIDGLRGKWGSFPERIRDLPGIPYPDVDSLRAAISGGQVVLQRFSYEYGPTIFSLFATRQEQAYLKFIRVVGFAGPAVGIVLAFTHRWWWLIPGVLTALLVMREHKKVYNNVIYRGALGSEEGFCFLYRVKQVCLTSPDSRTSLYWRE